MNTADPHAHFHIAYTGVPTIFRDIYMKHCAAYLADEQQADKTDFAWTWMVEVGQDFVPYIQALCPAGVDPESWIESLRMPYHYLEPGPEADDAAMEFLRGWFNVRFPDLMDFIANDEHGSIHGFLNGIDNDVINSRQIPRSEIDPALLAPVEPQAA